MSCACLGGVGKSEVYILKSLCCWLLLVEAMVLFMLIVFFYNSGV